MTTRTDTRASRPNFFGINGTGIAWQVPRGDRGVNTRRHENNDQ